MVFHFLGCLLLGYYIIAPLHYFSILYIWLVFVLLPFVAEAVVTAIRFGHNNKYDKVLLRT